MRRFLVRWKRPIAALAAGALLAGAGRAASAQEGGSRSPPQVTVAEVVEQAVPIERVYTGTTAPVKGIELRSQVTGYLLERKFAEGSDVKQGDVLYAIDPRPFQAVLDQKQGELQEQQATLEYAKIEVQRYSDLASRSDAPQERLDQANELQSQTEAAIAVSQAEINQAKIDLAFTSIEAPFDGRIGQTEVNIGALISANDTALASLVQLDPIYVYFNPPETDLWQIETSQAKAPLPAEVTLPRVDAPPFKGELSFIANTADARTGTIEMRATVANPERRLRPGQFVLVHLQVGADPDALVVPAQAVSSVQGQRFVMVVGKDDKLERRNVTLGRQVGSQGYVVEDGLSAGERVVVSDIRTLRGGMTVAPQPEAAS